MKVNQNTSSIEVIRERGDAAQVAIAAVQLATYVRTHARADTHAV
jgi:hypothetical protein